MTTICEDLRKAVLQAAIQGRLTHQLPEDGDAEDLYKEIQAEKQRLIQEGKIKKDKSLPEITEEEIPFDIPESWRWIRLANIAIGENGDRSSKYPVESDYVRMGIPFFGSKDMTENSMSFNKIRYISLEKFNELGNGKLINNDIVCLLRGSVGKTALFKETAEFSTGFICAQMMIVRCLSESFVDYVFLCMKTPEFANQVREKTTGTAVRQLPAKDVLQMMIPLPPLAEQKRIVACANELMKKIDEMEQTEKDITALYDAFPGDMKASLLQAAIQGRLTEQLPEDGNAEDLYKEIQAQKQKLIKEGKIKKEKPLPEITEKEIPFDIPENWKWVRLGDIGNLVRGSGIKKDETTKVGKPCVRYGEIYTSYWLEFSKVKTFTSIEVFSKCKQIRTGDLIFTLTGENKPDIAKTIAYLGNESVAVGGDLAIWSNHYCNPKFLSYYMYSGLAIAQKVDAATGDMIVHISCDKVGKFLLPLPPLTEQKRIVEKLDQLLPLCDAMKADISGGVGA